MWIQYPDGYAREGIVMSLTGTAMRVAAEGADDVLEFRFVNGLWMSENGDVVSFEFSPGLTNHELFRAALQPMLMQPGELPGRLTADPWPSCKSVN